MKKIIFSISAALIGLAATTVPLSGFSNTNPFLKLIQSATSTKLNWGVCGDPSQQTVQHFCHENHGNDCIGGFDQEVIDGCKQRLPAPSCQLDRIKEQMQTISVNTVCHKYPPAGTDYNVCVADINFFLANCN